MTSLRGNFPHFGEIFSQFLLCVQEVRNYFQKDKNGKKKLGRVLTIPCFIQNERKHLDILKSHLKQQTLPPFERSLSVVC